MQTGLSRKYVIPPDVLFQEIDGEVVLVSMTRGNYYGINKVGSCIWNFIQENGNPESAVEVLRKEYNIPEAQLREDVSRFIGDLLSAGLLFEEGQQLR